MANKFKFCILAAGTGSRNRSLKGLHKALLPIANRPVISVIMEKVPKEIPIVVALGYKADQIRTYLERVHPDRLFEFVYVENYNGPGSGPGLSLLKCKEVMQCPFIFTSADTIVDNNIKFSSVEYNWIGCSQVSNTESHEYCLLETNNNLVTKFFYGRNENAYAFTGIAGILDYEDFWDGLEQKNVIRGEHQVLDGLRNLKSKQKFNMNWLDTGNIRSYARTKSYYPNNVAVEKDNEAIFIDNGLVIKYFEDEERNAKRIQRATKIGKSAPKVSKINKNMFCYDYVEATRLSDVYDEKKLYLFLEDYQKNLRQINFKKDRQFIKNSKAMYEEKTFKRVEAFEGTSLDNIKYVNGVPVRPIRQMLEDINWSAVYDKSIPSLFHGDLQPENILVLNDGKYFYIDWREGFGEGIDLGDAYYDLGKLHHALVISNTLILKGHYNVDIKDSEAHVEYVLKNNLHKMLGLLQKFCEKEKYDYKHVELLGLLNYLNIASLYDNFDNGKYGNFLFLLGKKLLAEHLEKE